MIRIFSGELLGTFLLVLIGCGSVCLAAYSGVLTELWQVAVVWGTGVSLAIYASKAFCPAHLNPAVSLAMYFRKKIRLDQLFYFFLAQLVGAILAAVTLLILFESEIVAFELNNGIIRGAADSYRSAVAFGEFYPNPSFESLLTVTQWEAILYEAGATFILVKMIFLVTSMPAKFDLIVPLLIGLTVTLLILLVAPYTQAGMNPARDLGPRIVAYFGGWGRAALPSEMVGAVSVYVFGPMLGAGIAALTSRKS